MAIRRRSYYINLRSSQRDTVGILINGDVIYNTVEHWIMNDPLSLWNALYDGVHRLSLTYDAYLYLKKRMELLHPDKVRELEIKRNNYAILRQLKKKTREPNPLLINPSAR